MKTTRTFHRLALALALAAVPGFLPGQAAARTWLIDNNTANPADFRKLADAASSASVAADDVLLLSGSADHYDAGSNAITFNKRVHIVGPGYFLTQNAIPSANNLPAQCRVTLGAAAGGSTLTGIGGAFQILVHASNVTVSRCRFDNIYLYSSNVTVRQCYAVGGVTCDASSQNSLVTNSWMRLLNLSGTNCSAVNCVCDNAFSMIVGNTCSLVNSVVLNAAGSFNSSGTVSNCIGGTAASNPGGSASFLPAGNGNINGSSEAAIFAGGASPDMKYVLKTGSPATGVGMAGTDMGMFGGATPYVKSGLPPRPRIKLLTTSGTGNTATGLRIHVEAESKN